jgi:hypothetical protein
MLTHLGPSCPNRPFSTELDNTEINIRIQGVLTHGADQNFGSGPVPLREGVNNPWVRLLGLTSVFLCQFLLLNAYTFLSKILGTCAAPCRGSIISTMKDYRNRGKGDVSRAARSSRVHRSPITGRQRGEAVA